MFAGDVIDENVLIHLACANRAEIIYQIAETLIGIFFEIYQRDL